MTPTRPIRLGIVGCGFIGRLHLDNAVLDAGVELKAVADVDLTTAMDVAEEFVADRWTLDGFELCVAGDIDALVLATHPSHREALALEAIAHGKHVLLEKPVTTSLEGTVRIAQAAIQAGVVAAVNFKFRAAPAFQGLAAILGTPVMVSSNVAMPMLEATSPHMASEAGGGLLPNLGSHVFDLSSWLMGSRVAAQL